MAYIVYCDDEPIYDLRVEGLRLIDPVLNLELNDPGEFTFKIPPDHPLYDLPQRMVSRIVVEQDGEELFKGRIISETMDFYKRKSITCEGELAFLNDSILVPAEYHDISPRVYLETIIALHNQEVDEDRQFTVGTVTVEDSNDSLYRYTNMNSAWTEIKEDLVDDLGGYLRVRNENGTRYLDYIDIEDYGRTNTQPVEFGVNLLDFSQTIDMTDIATGIVPLGATLEESDFSALDVRLTIEDVNDGVAYIQCDEAVEKYGLILKTVTWDSVTTASMLLSKGKKYLEEYQWEPLVLELTAADLSMTENEFMDFKLGDYIEVISKPHGLDAYFPLSKMKIYLDRPASNKITLGECEDVSLSSKTASISSGLASVSAALPTSTVTLMQSAISQATSLITAATHGYVMLNDTDDDGYPDELVIMDTDDTETATNVWRWNLNGLGYSSTGYDGEYGTAITMDGQIIGTYIAAGTVGAEQLSVEYVESVETEISNAILTAEEYTEEELQNYYTVEEIKQELTAGSGVLDSIIAETYVTQSDFDSGVETLEATFSSEISQTSESILATLNEYYYDSLYDYCVNGDFSVADDALSGWVLSSSSYVSEGEYLGETCVEFSYSASVNQSFTTEEDGDIIIKFKAACGEGYSGSEIIMAMLGSEDQYTTAGELTSDSWTEFTFTFEGCEAGAYTLYLLGVVSTANIYITDVGILAPYTKVSNTTLTATAESLTASIEDTQNNARTYFAADSTSVSISTGTIAFESNTISIASDNFTLTEDGSIYATNGTFSGTLSAASVSGSLTAEDDDSWIVGCGITVNDGVFMVDTSGNVTMNGDLTLKDGVISWSSLSTTVTDAIDCAQADASDAVDLAEAIANGTYSKGTFINKTSIYSPTIYADEFVVMPESEASSSEWNGGYSMYGYFGDELFKMLSINYYEGDAPFVHFESPCDAYAAWDFGWTYFSGHVSFEDATVYGLSATFG